MLRPIEQHSRGRGTARGAHGARVLGPHQDSTAQPRGRGQLLCRGHPRSFDVTRGEGLDTEPRTSLVTAGTAGGDHHKVLECIKYVRVTPELVIRVARLFFSTA